MQTHSRGLDKVVKKPSEIVRCEGNSVHIELRGLKITSNTDITQIQVTQFTLHQFLGS